MDNPGGAASSRPAHGSEPDMDFTIVDSQDAAPGIGDGQPVAQPSDPPADSATTTLEHTTVGAAVAQELECIIRSMNPAYARLSLIPKIRKGRSCYVLSVRGDGAQYCLNKGGGHRRSNIYFVVNRIGVSQKCFAGRATGGPCARFRSAPSPITPALRDALFAPSATPAGAQRDLLRTPRTLAEPLLCRALLGDRPGASDAPGAAQQTSGEAHSQGDAPPDSSLPSSSAQPPPAPPTPSPVAAPQRRAKRKASECAEQAPKLRKSETRGANGRPIVLAGIKYSVDVASLRAYAATDEALRTKKPKDAYKNCVPMTDREKIDRFLKRVQPTASGDGLCVVSYTRSEVGQALVDAGFLQHARLYPDTWPSCAAHLGGSKLRGIASGKFYVEMDDKDAFHKLLQSLTGSEEAKALIERVVADEGLKPTLSTHYFGTPDRVKDVKELLHMVSNGGKPKDWRKKCGASCHDDPPFVLELQRAMDDVTRELAQTGVGPQAVKFIAAKFPTKTRLVPDPQPDDPDKMKCVEAARDPAKCWKSYLLQRHEVLGLLAKMDVAARFGVSCGPPLHDCLFVERAPCLPSISKAMSEAMLAMSRVNV